jgi:hypothetical protein
MTAPVGVTFRPAFPDDAATVARLAALDSRRVPPGPLLLAEVDGEAWAAITLTGAEEVLADPFRPTAEILELLRRRAAQLGAPARPWRRAARFAAYRRRHA